MGFYFLTDAFSFSVKNRNKLAPDFFLMPFFILVIAMEMNREHRRKPMKSSTKDQAEGKLHQMKGKIKEIAGKVSMNHDLEAEGGKESRTGKVQEKIGAIRKVVGK
jgi:uncharacterized protein YjbJ (UPF0337 family)